MSHYLKSKNKHASIEICHDILLGAHAEGLRCLVYHSAQLNSTAGKFMGVGGVCENLVKTCNKALNEPLNTLSCVDYPIKITS